ncbi:glycosyl hydrolase 108 family protein [Acetobacter senegalensis]|uniref:glycosyl hydrolase 108 family protein n=1 Tax=Acetobacter senegalensis TaxID=446692 RepID=UPI00264B7EE9|nr:glycosyl hydrolase 108 family protein [Acetobacter senegalensis]MDN7351780.1 glycosyl hydrolase 108 family protein [Acetobacter senegalensis]
MSAEGGYQCNKADDGNWSGGRVGRGNLAGTKYGISAALMALVMGSVASVTQSTMQRLKMAQAREIATERFWQVMRCDDLPAGVDVMLFDFGFNSTPERAVKHLQRAVNIKAPDGIMGPETLHSVENVSVYRIAPLISRDYAEQFQAWLGVSPDGQIGPLTLRAAREQQAHDVMLVYALASQQEAAYRSFKNFPIFGDGWLNRLEARVAIAHQFIAARDAPAAVA